MPYNQLKKFMVKKLKHDALVKKLLTEKIAAQEFLEYCHEDSNRDLGKTVFFAT